MIYQLSQEEVCHEANATLVIVQSCCPDNDIIYQERSKRKMCETYPKCLGEPLVYHCVRSKGSLVEVCAPNGPIVGLSACLSICLSIDLSFYLSFSLFLSLYRSFFLKIHVYAISDFWLIVTKYSSLLLRNKHKQKAHRFYLLFFP